MQQLKQAFNRFSGGCFTPDEHGSWQKLAASLSSQGVDPHEYAYWLIFINPPPEDTPMAYDSSVLSKRNLVCSPFVKDRFLAWRKEHDAHARITTTSQVNAIRDRVRIGTPLEDILLDPDANLGAMTRCEAALRWLDTPDKVQVRAQVLTAYQPMACMILMGCPIYRQLCPLLMQYVRERGLL